MFDKLKELTFAKPDSEQPFSYYEYKYLVPHSDLSQVKSILDELMGHSDPFPQGIVDSIYYDTQNELFLNQCIDGDADKIKFRIRGYGESCYLQLHQKIKALSGVYKHKSNLRKISPVPGHAPLWDELVTDTDFQKHNLIKHTSEPYGFLIPSIRVQYFRYRYRTFDYRITLDTNVEVFSLANGISHLKSYGQLPYHVLEIKTLKERPTLPFLGLIKLEQVSFSKFMLGSLLLNSED